VGRHDKKRVLIEAQGPEEIRRLIRTPVGRRLVLKLGGASALALAAGNLGGCGDDEGPFGSTPTPAPTVTPTPVQRPREIRDVFCALSGAEPVENLSLSAGANRYPIETLTPLDRQALADQGGGYSFIDPERLTHVARNVDLPSDQPLLLYVRGQLGADTVYVAETIHIPIKAVTFAWRAALILAGSAAQLLGGVDWLAELGISSPQLITAEDLADLTTTITPSSIAAALVYKHPEIASLESDSSAVTMALLLADPGVSDLAADIAQLLQQGIPYAVQEPVLDDNGQQIYITDPSGATSVPAYTLEINTDLDDRFNRAVGLCIDDVKNSMDLEGKTWNLTPGTPPQPQPAESQIVPGDDGFNVTTGWSDYKHGIKVTVDSFDPTTRQIPIKVWNNYVRYVGVYVQYLDGQGNPLSPGSGTRNTDYCDWLTDVPDMPELFGIPLEEGKNYSQATLTFPDGATAARLLVCGLGNSAYGTSWRDFFPSNAYSGRLNPDECTWGIIMTSVLDIGVILMFLAMDVGNTKVADTYRQMAGNTSEELMTAFQTVIRNIAITNRVLAVTALIVSAGATTGDLVVSGGSLAKAIWADLAKMGAILARLLATAPKNQSLKNFFQAILAYFVEAETAEKLIPVVGEVIAAMAVIGDVAQLAQTSAEVGTSPWVIDDTIHVTYTATVTLKHDPKDAVFPRSATKWTLTPVIGGSGSRDPITGDVTPVGTRSDPIVVTVTDVPISGTIQYSVTFINADGAQVGKGATAKLANNDVNNLPRTVEITIQEIAIPITAHTVFERQNTTAYSTADNGYTWTTNNQVGGTVQDKTGILEINSITVGTVSGMAGYVWRASETNQYWIRNLPTIQNEGQPTIQLQTGGPYSRKPLVVYDRLNPDLVNGNNFLLEPEEQGTGYQVRRLKLSADGGTLGWNAGESWGQFLNPLSAVTLHPSGYLVGVNAETGKLDVHRIPPNPTDDTNLPPMASVYAGPGTRPGLTQTPVGVAITITGVVVVLEAGANRLQAFDLAGNPVAYLGTDPNNLSYYAPLASGGNDTLLSLAVDGQGWFYVLSYTGDGSQVSDYAVDVYNPQGVHIVRSPGLNAATFDVDYWRNIFALNFAPLANTDGTPHVDATTGVVEPSTSICIPHNPS
jgi:hypothetical protein